MLILQDITASYGRTQVLHSVSLESAESGILAVLGHNGAGKSTLLRTAIGLINPTSGRVLFDGEDISTLPPHSRIRKGMAYVPQGQQSFTQLTCWENLRVVADLHGRPGHARVDDALGRFPALHAVMDRPAGLLSGGQRQQLAIARALISGPRLLLLDEPTEGIQPSVVTEIQQAITELAAGGMGILLVEQNMGFALEVAREYAVISRGRIVETGMGVEDKELKHNKVKMSLAI
ncbi:urea ABC transporter ATP-binding subunit UrtE [Corynebacterium efficiens]|nr:urea ABC transporter ATP-binding subunit UrtE [Corynebacterium efficiens]